MNIYWHDKSAVLFCFMTMADGEVITKQLLVELSAVPQPQLLKKQVIDIGING